MFKEDWAATMVTVEHQLPSFVAIARKNHPAGTPLFANVEIDVTTSRSYMGDGWAPNRAGIVIYSLRVSETRPPDSSRVVAKSSGFWPPGYMSETTRLSFSFAVPDSM